MLVIRMNQAMLNRCMVLPEAEHTIWEYYGASKETDVDWWVIWLLVHMEVQGGKN